ncbi:MAG: VWA domain-containing protein [Gammaproteobacteria bacterium]|nr:VWA domain-containing protein [Gammaproteobacteria bacterium]
MLEFLWPWAFCLVLLFPIMRLAALRVSGRHAALTVPDVDAFRFESTSTDVWIDNRRWLKILVLFLAWVLLVGALARPQWTGEPIPLPTVGRDMLLAVDISGSMTTDDMSIEGNRVSRLAALKHVVEPFILSRIGDRLGLILFGSSAYVYVPLTFDLETVNELLQDAPTGIAGGQTAIGDTIGLAVKRLIERPIDHRILILMTDGSHNEGTLSPDEAVRLAKEANVRIHTIGIGSEPSDFRTFGSRRMFRFRGPAMNTEALRSIADETGGKFFKASDTESLSRIYLHIAAIEPIELDPETLRPIKSLFHWPLGASFALFLILWWIRS